MRQYGKSYKQWLNETERAIRKRGFSSQYANAQTLCVRSLYINRYSFQTPEYAAKYALRKIIRI